ncbi:zinc finger CCCH domain-containing protein 11 isoform X1 [Selaginella moellendorffii]|uniref:zinc finger CCCH domain-containing protein 11 isoform X1 n=1 Tax=Selaginella moellendorffii TaxID=88036 RepID=UPI000D1C53A9|nr:zinc finger CCCH domain-containing protein 11 isoform X1 [Selaginella moellendorffii]|eukprot:XP_024524223.1 zinc finger CCCH domain-containing protein 11 isoform X1 [Selaginella moellendorffii]
MPPKAADKGSKEKQKADLAKKQKLVEDKTFGLKNKNKSKNVQKYVASLQQSVQSRVKREEDPKAAQKKKKEEETQREKELNELFKVAISQPKVPVGVDPKSVVCEFFRRGQCAKGFKCKYSHDLNVERKGEKIDLYSDQRDNETMEEWDQETLEKVVESKGNEYMNNKPTEIVCKYFLDAVEKKQYGWFWVCPNGGKDCHYRHALPPGYVLKSQMKALLEEEAEKLSIEEEIEEQRTKVSTTTPLNATIFSEWKKRKEQEREAMLAQKRAERAKNDRMSGRELFASDASLFVDDLEACDEYERDEEEPGSSSKAQDSKATDTAVTAAAGSSSASADPAEIDEDDEAIPDVEDDDLDEDELNELEARLASSGVGGDT